jgi:hypothetical protein
MRAFGDLQRLSAGGGVKTSGSVREDNDEEGTRNPMRVIALSLRNSRRQANPMRGGALPRRGVASYSRLILR